MMIQGSIRVSSRVSKAFIKVRYGFYPKGKLPGLLSNQGEKSINFYFIMVPLRKKS